MRNDLELNKIIINKFSLLIFCFSFCPSLFDILVE